MDDRHRRGGAVARVNALEVAAPGSVQRFEAIRHRLAITEFRGDAEKQARLALIRELLEDELLRQHASTRGIRVKPAEVEAEVSRLRARFPSEEAFGAFALRVSGGVPQLREGLRFRLTLDALYRNLGYLPFTTTQRDATWSAFRDRWARPERVVADHVLFALPKDTTEAEVADARTRIEALRTALMQPGADFAAIARANSEAPSAVEGGALGDVLRDRTPKAFETAAFELPVGVLSEPVRSAAGLHLIRVHRRDPARVADAAELDRESPRLLPALHRRWVRSALITSLAPKAQIEPLTPEAQAVVPLLGTMPWLVPEELGPDAPDWPFDLAP